MHQTTRPLNMSHNVTVTRTVTSSHTTSTLVVNTGYLKTTPGLLKLVELILGAICVGMISWYYTHNHLPHPELLFFLLMCTSFLIGTFCLLVSCVFSLSTGGIISKTIYELIYHSVAVVLLLSASVALLIQTNKYSDHYIQGKYFVASILGVVNSVLYVFSAVLARRSYRGI